MPDPWNWLPPEFRHDALPVATAALLGAAVGAEREWRRHPGGLRSCALVSAAAAVFGALCLRFGMNNPAGAFGSIATGVGFLGGGVILRTRAQVRGLSTAATFWAVAAVGQAAGMQAYPMALTLTAIILFAHVGLRSVSAWIERVAPPEDPGPR